MSGQSQIIKLVNELQDKLSPIGKDKLAFKLPQIAVIGGQSAGKSSVLEGFVGRDFLPRGSDIVTRRPLILQLINITEAQAYGTFNHIPNKLFFDFEEIMEEITEETDREVANSGGISENPIHLKIYSPDVCDLTLIDLPGMTRNPLDGQRQDIAKVIERMILNYIKEDNCLILAVTAANQDIATSDAVELAKKVDPTGRRTIGVLTKLDLMDKGTDARHILDGRTLPLKLGYIGVINRSQEDIVSKKELNKALSDEQDYFINHPAYCDISDRLGMKYLQKFLNEQLVNHIIRTLPQLKHDVKVEFEQFKDELEQMGGNENINQEEAFERSRNSFLENIKMEIGGKGEKVIINRETEGSLINKIINTIFFDEIDAMEYDNKKLRVKITHAIKSASGAFQGLMPSDFAIKAVIQDQIDQFQKPSSKCCEMVYEKLENIISGCAETERFKILNKTFEELTMEFARQCKKNLKERVSHYFRTEKFYLNYLPISKEKMTSSDKLIPILFGQKLLNGQISGTKQDKTPRSGYIEYQKKKFWFHLDGQTLAWFKDEKMKDKKNSVNLFAAQFEQQEQTLFLNLRKSVNPNIDQLELHFDQNGVNLEQWKDWFKQAGAKSMSSPERTDKHHSSSDLSISSFSMDTASVEPAELKSQIDYVHTIVDCYSLIMKEKIKDYIPKLAMVELLESTIDFITNSLRARVMEEYSSIDELLQMDPEEEKRRQLIALIGNYDNALNILNKYTERK